MGIELTKVEEEIVFLLLVSGGSKNKILNSNLTAFAIGYWDINNFM